MHDQGEQYLGEGGDHVIYLKPETYCALQQFAAWHWPEFENLNYRRRT
jgi:hypothetical protein